MLSMRVWSLTNFTGVDHDLVVAIFFSYFLRSLYRDTLHVGNRNAASSAAWIPASGAGGAACIPN